MATPNRPGSSGLDLSCLELGAEVQAQLALLQQQSRSSAESTALSSLAVSPGSDLARRERLFSASSCSAPNASLTSPKGTQRSRASVVDGRGDADAPSSDDFATPPVWASSVLGKRVRGGGNTNVHRAVHPAASSQDASGEVPLAPFRCRGRGRGRGRGAAAAMRQLASNLSPLVRHARVVVERPVADRRLADDADDAIDNDDDNADSDEPLEHEQDADDDEPSAAEHAEAAVKFDHSCWSVYAAEGVSAEFPDAPLETPPLRRTSEFGPEVPPFSRQDISPGAIKTVIKNAHGAGTAQACTSTLQFVRLLFTDAVVEKLVNATNKAAAEHPRCKELVRIQRAWTPLTAERLMLWFAIATFLGVVKVQNRKCAWSKRSIFHQKWVSGQMGQQEFENILTCLNSCDHWNLTEAEFQRRQRANVFWQMDELLQECNSSSQAYFRLGHRIDVDEAVIPWKGKHKARCYNSNKPYKFHFKKFMLNDAATGYNYNFYYYGGKDEVRPADIPATTWPVVKLLSTTDVNLENKNHIVALDNWFTSSRTHAWLASKGFVAVGTVGPKKLQMQTATRPAGFPKGGIFKKSTTRAKGAYVVHKGKLVLDGGRSADCYVSAWQDRSPVHILSTYPPVKRSCTRKVKVDGVFVEGQWPQPSVVHHYNISMKGTDLHDQRVAAFRTVVKSQRWQVRIVTDLFT